MGDWMGCIEEIIDNEFSAEVNKYTGRETYECRCLRGD